VTDSRFLVFCPYSSWVRPAVPRGYLPHFEENSWTSHREDLIAGHDAYSTWMPRYCPQASLSFITAYPWGVLEWLSKPLLGRTTNP
jgi:hypothetical protein